MKLGKNHGGELEKEEKGYTHIMHISTHKSIKIKCAQESISMKTFFDNAISSELKK